MRLENPNKTCQPGYPHGRIFITDADRNRRSCAGHYSHEPYFKSHEQGNGEFNVSWEIVMNKNNCPVIVAPKELAERIDNIKKVLIILIIEPLFAKQYIFITQAIGRRISLPKFHHSPLAGRSTLPALPRRFSRQRNDFPPFDVRQQPCGSFSRGR